MRPAPNALTSMFKVKHGPMGIDSHTNEGMYLMMFHNVQLRVLASDTEGWDHVSVSTPTRCPTWEEMSYVKSLFFTDDETVIQLHVPVRLHINNHPFCLHLWRQHGVEIALPPSWMVGVRSMTAEEVRADPHAAYRQARNRSVQESLRKRDERGGKGA